MIYLDYNATTPLDPAVTDAMQPFLEPGVEEQAFGNPSSSHEYGEAPREAVRVARGRVAELIGAKTDEIVFTSGGSESNNTALKGVAKAAQPDRKHIITTVIEHPAVLEPCRYLESQGYEVSYLPVDGNARLDPAEVRKALRPDTLLVSVMHSNNEVGTLQPIGDIAEVAAENGTLVHTDASQSVGKVPLDVDELGVDFLTVAGHKLYAPKGIGALYVRDSSSVEPLIHGAGQEGGLRAGTESVPLAVGLGKACEVADPEVESTHLRELRDKLWTRLDEGLGEDVVLNGHSTKRLPNTLNVSFVGREADSILDRSSAVAASTGSACHSDRVELSPVLEAMGIDPEVGKGAIRLSTGRFTEEDDLRRAAEVLLRSVKKDSP
ncbi:MAG: cysteine desulfurase family protein [bacterium]